MKHIAWILTLWLICLMAGEIAKLEARVRLLQFQLEEANDSRARSLDLLQRAEKLMVLCLPNQL